MKLPLADIGSESEKGVVAALDDLFGPSFRELGEYLADKVRYHRLRALSKITRRAKEFGPDVSGHLKPPPLKFLLPFVESASLEDETDDTLCTMWAKLLADASTAYDAKQLHFIRILREISGKEARLMHAMATSFRGDPRSATVYANEYGVAQQFMTPSYAKNFLLECRNRLPPKCLAQEFIGQLETGGSHIHYIDIVERMNDDDIWMTVEDGISGRRTEMVKEHGSLTFELLRAVSLIEELRCDLVEDGALGIEFKAWAFTGLGGEFYDHCAKAAFTES